MLPDEYEFVLRKNGAGGEVTYGQVALSVSMEELSGDADGSSGQKSIEIDNKVMQLHDFDGNGTTLPKVTITSADTSLLPSGD